ncbi:TNT domain-containing protein [Allonocardiopsis opalescens]|uniref:Uncharacterized protein DUF4237 n=1 Tax=Allonocardiopsis opalescens TaxID=1144618 RepID=A0A2T0PTR3_9ACTN|nr:TNT domain-containing protein [Allonocardiopsis opalescens]PRX92295.1 uncharacterized protein DUF4237 [Allonocardiopsis opalescens]
MSSAPHLDQSQQYELLQHINQVIVPTLQPGWASVELHYRALGRATELDAVLTLGDGRTAEWMPPGEAAAAFDRLRAGMYRDAVGTWLSVRLLLSPDGRFEVTYNFTDEPAWQLPPPAADYRAELDAHPRSAEHLPDWWRARLDDAPLNAHPAPAPPPGYAATGPAPVPAAGGAPQPLREARPHDGLAGDGRAYADRTPLSQGEAQQVLAYLAAGPVVLATPGLNPDEFAPERGNAVPADFHTDGTWIWPAAVAYYLREHGVAPEADLIAHIRAQGYRPPQVGDYAVELATAQLFGDPLPPAPAEAPPAPAPPAEAAPPAPVPEPPVEAHTDAGQPPRPAPAPGRDEQQVLERLRRAIAAAGVPADRYAIGTPQQGRLVLEPEEFGGGGWQVHYYEQAPGGSQPRGEGFDGVYEAAAFFLGRLILDHAADGGGAAASGPQPPVHHEPPAPPAEPRVPTGSHTGPRPPGPLIPPPDPQNSGASRLAPPVETSVQSGTGAQAAMGGIPQPPPPYAQHSGPQPPQPPQPPAPQPAPQRSALATSVDRSQMVPLPERHPIEALPGEPPSTLFRNLQMIELPPTTEIDRIGNLDGNLVYAAGTDYANRSLPPDWVRRDYHVFRVERPMPALMGVAVPWFEQPGGGTGLYLDRPIGQLLAEGYLVEIPEPTMPPPPPEL